MKTFKDLKLSNEFITKKEKEALQKVELWKERFYNNK